MSAHHDVPDALEEPQTPLWLPFLGGVLFLIAGLAWAASSASTDAPGTAPTGTKPATVAPSGH